MIPAEERSKPKALPRERPRPRGASGEGEGGNRPGKIHDLIDGRRGSRWQDHGNYGHEWREDGLTWGIPVDEEERERESRDQRVGRG